MAASGATQTPEARIADLEAQVADQGAKWDALFRFMQAVATEANLRSPAEFLPQQAERQPS
jgi:hypothetical protein